jgi:hypothetical protein
MFPWTNSKQCTKIRTGYCCIHISPITRGTRHISNKVTTSDNTLCSYSSSIAIISSTIPWKSFTYLNTNSGTRWSIIERTPRKYDGRNILVEEHVCYTPCNCTTTKMRTIYNRNKTHQYDEKRLCDCHSLCVARMKISEEEITV